MREVVARLGLSHGGGTYTGVRSRMEQLGLEPPSASERAGGAAAPRRASAWRRRFSEEDLQAAVGTATSLHGVFRELGLQVGGGQWMAIRQLIVERGWSTSHWRSPLRRGGRRPEGDVARFRAALDEADLATLVAEARSRADVIRVLGFEPQPSVYRVLRRALEGSDISTAHFEAAYLRMLDAPPRAARPLEEVLRAGTHVSTHGLKQRLLEEGVFEHRCSSCELTEWRGGPIPLQLDHIDGDRTNNVIENLRLLCPNCHALTDTYCGRNIGRR